MHYEHLNVIREEICAQILKSSGQGNLKRVWNLHIDMVISFIVAGDTKGLALRLKRIAEMDELLLSTEHQRIVSAAEYILTSWVMLEQTHGAGSLLNYRDILKCSAPWVYGVSNIENAKNFQSTNVRDPSDPFWALQFVQEPSIDRAA